jgi:hypothetical protein
MTLQELISTTNNNAFVLFSDDAAPDTIQQNTIEWDWYRTIFNDEDFEEKVTEELLNYLDCDTLPKFVHIYEMIIPDGDEEPLCLKLQNSYTLQLTEEEIEKLENWYDEEYE